MNVLVADISLLEDYIHSALKDCDLSRVFFGGSDICGSDNKMKYVVGSTAYILGNNNIVREVTSIRR